MHGSILLNFQKKLLDTHFFSYAIFSYIMFIAKEMYIYCGKGQKEEHILSGHIISKYKFFFYVYYDTKKSSISSSRAVSLMINRKIESERDEETGGEGSKKRKKRKKKDERNICTHRRTRN